jgi:tryptophan halogenase
MPLLLESRATDHGWIVRVPLQDRSIGRYLYSDRYLDATTAARELGDRLFSGKKTEAVTASIRNGHRQRFWYKNCVALGNAAGALEPLQTSALHFIHAALSRLTRMLPDARCEPSLADEYNQRMREEFQCSRDFLLLEYRACSWRDTPFWQSHRKRPLPDSLQRLVTLFRSRGRVASFEDGLHSRDDWINALLDADAWPQGYDPLLDKMDLRLLREHFGRMHAAINAAVANLPVYGADPENG